MTKIYNQINHDKELRDYYNEIRKQFTDDAYDFMMENIIPNYNGNELVTDEEYVNKHIIALGYFIMFTDMELSLKLISRSSGISTYNIFIYITKSILIKFTVAYQEKS